jgi:hypothetical protein
MRHPQLIKRRKIMFYEAVTSSAGNDYDEAASLSRTSSSSAGYAEFEKCCAACVRVHPLFAYGRGCKEIGGFDSRHCVDR